MSQLDVTHFNVDDRCSMIKKRDLSEAACVKGDVYVFGGFDKKFNWIKTVEKYSVSTDSWSKIADMYDDRMYQGRLVGWCTAAIAPPENFERKN